MHNEGDGLLYRLLKVYVRRHELGFVGIGKMMTTLTRNDYEPDIYFLGREKADQVRCKK